MLIILPILAQAVLVATPSCANPLTQAELNACAAEDYSAADKALNAAWSKADSAMRALDSGHFGDAIDNQPGYFDTLLEAQRAWLAYRDAHCRSEGYSARGGSMEPMLVSGCMAELTKMRTRQLNALAEWPR